MQAGFIIDGVIGFLFIIFLYRGLIRGFSGEIIGMVGFIVGMFCAWKFTDAAVILVQRYAGSFGLDGAMLSLLCAMGIFFIVEIIFAVIGWFLSYVVKVTQLSLTDHVMGMVLAVVKTAFLILIVYGVLATFSNVLPTEEWTEQSYTMKGASYVWPYARDFLESRGIIDFSELTGK